MHSGSAIYSYKQYFIYGSANGRQQDIEWRYFVKSVFRGRNATAFLTVREPRPILHEYIFVCRLIPYGRTPSSSPSMLCPMVLYGYLTRNKVTRLAPLYIWSHTRITLVKTTWSLRNDTVTFCLYAAKKTNGGENMIYTGEKVSLFG